jgi:cytochrome d ubiquinol oxidase subunit I
MAAIATWTGWRWWNSGRLTLDRPWLWALIASGPLGFVAIEAGWVVTEVGRQPWIIDHVMRTADAVTPMPGLRIPMVIYTHIAATYVSPT